VRKQIGAAVVGLNEPVSLLNAPVFHSPGRHWFNSPIDCYVVNWEQR
jgi:hypothetical protein